jgi:putative transposase
MPNSYTQLYVQLVFVVKFRRASIQREWRSHFMSVIGNMINETGCKTIIVNGVEDHVHCFLHLSSTITIAELCQKVKARSAKWVNESGNCSHRFEWQTGYGAFTYSKSAVSNVFNYIQNQEEHHRRKRFFDEYLEFLKEFEIDYDERYLFKEPE